MNTWFAHTVAREGGLAPLTASVMEYVLAGNGVFARAKRTGMEVLLPVSPCEVRGLPDLEPYLRLEHPKLPGAMLEAMFEESRRACRAAARPIEALFHIFWDGGWQVVMPPQEASAAHVRPLETGVGSSFERAIIEIHSHHGMDARFSRRDDEDERAGFRLYGVLGRIFDAPELRLRVGCHGYFHEFPIDWLFDDTAALAAPLSEER